MFYEERATVAHVDCVRAEWPGMMSVDKLLDRHVHIISLRSAFRRYTVGASARRARTVLLGHRQGETTMLYTRVMYRPAAAVTSPLYRLAASFVASY